MTLKIDRSAGTTDSERYLAKLADSTFLDIWSYPNTFKADEKEHADLLVVCGDDVIIFSDKDIEWPANGDINVRWARWYRAAVLKSVKQIRGAERYIRGQLGDIFLDAARTQELPIELPPLDRMRIHGVAVTRGTKAPCKAHFGGGSGALAIAPEIVAEAHTDPTAMNYSPFAIGDIDPHGPFVHVLDDVTLDIVLQGVDTISDFVAYLRRKEAFVRSGLLGFAEGEEDLLAVYLTRMNAAGEHDFVEEDGSPFVPATKVVLRGGSFAALARNPAFLAKVRADKVSYAWDDLIRQFTAHMLAGTSVVPTGADDSFRNSERVLRHLAFASRFDRRIYGTMLLDALDRARHHPRYVRFIPPAANSPVDTGFVFLALKVPRFALARGYDQYRETRQAMMYGYGLRVLSEHPELKRVVILGMEPPPLPGEKGGGSEDIALMEQPEWTEERLAELSRYTEGYDIMRPERVQAFAYHEDEYPNVPDDFVKVVIRRPGLDTSPKMSRQQRRAAERARAKGRR